MNNSLIYKKHVFLFVLSCFSFLCSYSQQGRLPTQEELDIKANLQSVYTSNSYVNSSTPNHIMVTGPEQNCNNAIPVCQQTYTQTSSYSGHGSIQEVPSSTCLSSQETNSVWYIFTVQNSGTFTFMLNTPNDYDFALYDITTIGCSGVPSATPVRCNFSATYGNTGLTLPAAAGNLSYNASQAPTMSGINVTVGQTFALIIDNYSANANGYTLTFGGTAQIFDNTPPAIGTLTTTCGGNSFDISFSEPIKCTSIAANGSDFVITGPGSVNVPVISAVGNLCSGGAANTSFATVTFNNTGLTTGTYTVSISNGTDGNTILDKCNNVMLTPQIATFQFLAPITMSATNTIVCSGGPSTLTVLGVSSIPGLVYSWAPISANTPSVVVNPTGNITYIATVTYGGCTRSASQAITVGQPPVVTVNPNTISLCSGTTPLIASATMFGLPCPNCNYTWAGAATQTNNAVPSSTITNAGPGTYSVSVTSIDGCIGNTAVSTVNILSPTSTPLCNIIYVSPAGGGNGLTPATPTDIQTAVTMAACNSVVIKMMIGDYTINNPINMGSYITIEGGYDAGFTLKTSSKATAGGFPAQGTRILRSTANVEGSGNTIRLTGITITAGSSNFRLQDIRVDMPDNAAGSSISNYGIYLGSGCSSYNITRCYVYSGNAGTGTTGATGAVGVNGSNGAAAPNGNTSYTAPQGNSGAGGNGGGGSGLGGSAKIYPGSGAAQTGNVGNVASGTRDGGGGASGGTGVFNASSPAGGAFGGSGASGGSGVGGGTGVSGGTGLANTSASCGGSASINGLNGNNGANGPVGSPAGTVGAGSDATGFWNIGNGTAGANGFGGAGGSGGGGGGGGFNPSQTAGCGPSYGTSAGGAGGGGGGQGGAGGLGGAGGGATYGIFIFNNGANGNVVDCQIFNGTLGTGGTGGGGGTGGTGGTGGVSSNALYGGCGNACNAGAIVGNGGLGGNGGSGGAGASGGAGGAGIASVVRLVGGSPLTTNTTVNMLTQPIITVDNKACTNVSIGHNSAVASPVWSSYGTSATPASGAGAATTTTYSATGRKTVVMNANNYTDFNNIIVSPPSTGNIVASASSICAGNANFASSVAGTAGLTYSWTTAPAGGIISSASSSSTSISFANTGTTPITYTVTLSFNSQCCGALIPVTTTITVYPFPAAPAATVNSICMGGTATFTATTPAGSSFNWYNAATTGTLLASGNTYSVSNVTTSYTVYLQATNSGGCSSTLTPVVITPTAIPAPTAIPGTACDVGLVQVGITPAAGVINYDWFSNAAGTTLIQSGNGLSYGQTILTAGGSYTVYVQSNIPGCAPSGLIPVTGSVSATPITAAANITPNDTVCIGTSISIALTPGGGNGTFTYTWSPVTSSLSAISQTVNASTSFNVFIGSNGCVKQFYFPIIVKPYPKDTITPASNITCTNTLVTLNGSFSASGPSYTYSWTTSTAGSITSATNVNTVTVNAGGIYTLSITDITTGCVSTQTMNVAVTNSPPVAQVAVPSLISCTTNTVALNATGSATGAGITYSWTTTSGNITSGSNAIIASAGAPGTYTLTITDTNTGCKTVTTTVVGGSNTGPNVIAANGVFPCGATTTSITVTSTVTGVTYNWAGPTSTSIVSGGNTNSPTLSGPGIYTVTVTNPVTGCSTTTTVAITQSSINAAFTADPTTGMAPLTVNLTNQSTGGSLTYNWNFGNGSNSTTVNPATTYTTNGTHTITLIASSGNCVDTATAVIIVEDGLTIEIPNVFTPNNDTKNDFFTIKTTGVKELSLQVFNRWGEKLYEFTGVNAAWDGLTPHGNKVPDATYFYFVKATGFDNKTIEKHGTVNLFR